MPRSPAGLIAAILLVAPIMALGQTARPRLAALPAEQRLRLAESVFEWLNDERLLAHEKAFHFDGDPDQEDYAAFVAVLEGHLTAKGLGHFVPLPAWDPSDVIPPELLAVKPGDSGGRRPRIRRAGVRRFPDARALETRLCDLSRADVERLLRQWHDFVLEDMAGAADTEESSAAPISWCWHAHLAEIKLRWRSCPSQRADR